MGVKRPNLSASLLLGIDVGSTRVKAVVFDPQGQSIAQAEQAIPVDRPQPGWVERDCEVTWDASLAVIREVAGGRADQIAAVGLTGCGNGAVFIDRRMRPVRAGILSSDTRAAAFVTPTDSTQGQQAYAGQLPFLVQWLRHVHPVQARQTAYAIFWKDWIRTRLTGSVCTDFTDASAAGMLCYPTRKLRASDLLHPPLQSSLQLAGLVTPRVAEQCGLLKKTPVYTGCIDCEAAALGSGVNQPGDILMIAGTWAINQTYLTRAPRRSTHFLVNESVQPDRWLAIEGSPRSTANFEWIRHVLGARDLTPKKAITEAIRTSHSGLLFSPRVPTGRGEFIGLGSHHTRGDLIRAVMEGIVFAHREHVEALVPKPKNRGVLTLTGGASRDARWCQLFADGLGCAIRVPKVDQLGARGAALCAGVGQGFWKEVTDAQSSFQTPINTYLPNPIQREQLEDTYRRFRQSILRNLP